MYHLFFYVFGCKRDSALFTEVPEVGDRRGSHHKISDTNYNGSDELTIYIDIFLMNNVRQYNGVSVADPTSVTCILNLEMELSQSARPKFHFTKVSTYVLY